MKTNKNKKGFTLVELVIVIAVIAILAAVLIPTFITVIGNANKSAAEQEGANVKTEILTLYGGQFDEYCKDYVAKGPSTEDTANGIKKDGTKVTLSKFDKAPLLLADMDEYKDNGYGTEANPVPLFKDYISKIKDSTEIEISYTETDKGTITYTTDAGYQVKITAREVTAKKV